MNRSRPMFLLVALAAGPSLTSTACRAEPFDFDAQAEAVSGNLELQRFKSTTPASEQKKWCPQNTGSKADAGWLRAMGPPVVDVTARFLQIFEAVKSGKNRLPIEAKEHVYLLVGGIFTSHYPRYMKGNFQRLEKLGLDVRKAPIHTEETTEANARSVRDKVLEIAREHRQVVLIGHSKGGADAAAAVAMYPEVRPHVRALVSMQAPYGGSLIANDMLTHPSSRRLFHGFIARLLKGNPQSFHDMSYEARKAFIAAHPYPVDVPTVSLATSRSIGMSVLSECIYYISRCYGLKSDGLVVDMDAEIPGSRAVRLADMDHGESAFNEPPKIANYKPGDLTEALVTLALEQ